MKKLLLILILWLIASPCMAFSPAIQAVVSSSVVAAGGDSCTGDLLFSWHGENLDVTVGSPAGCSAGDTTGTAVSAAAIDTDGTPAPKDGSGACSFPTAGDSFSFTISSEDIIKHASGTLDTWLYISTFDSDATLLKAAVDTNNYVDVRLKTSTTNQLRLVHNAGATTRMATTTVSGGLSLSTWYHVIAKWDETAHGSNYLSICVDETNGTTNCGDTPSALGTWAGTLSTLSIGEVWGIAAATFLDNLKIYGTWQ